MPSEKGKSSLIIHRSMNSEEREATIHELARRSYEVRKVRERFDHLFGATPPHIQIKQIIDFNMLCLNTDMVSQIKNEIKSCNIDTIYHHPFHILEQITQIGEERYWEKGCLLSSNWKRDYHREQFGAINPHHLYPQSRGGTSSPRNLRKFPRIPHDHFHIVFQNLTPTEQIELLLRRHIQDLQTHFSQNIRSILSLQDIAIYRKGVRALTPYGYQEE